MEKPPNKALELTPVNVAIFRARAVFRSRSEGSAGVLGCSSAWTFGGYTFSGRTVKDKANTEQACSSLLRV